MKGKKIFRRAFALFLIFGLNVGLLAGAPLSRAEAGEDDDPETNAYGITIENMIHDCFYGSGFIDVTHIEVKCPTEWKDKIRYQWEYENANGDDYELLDIEGETKPSFCPSPELLEKSRWFCCIISVEGDAVFSLRSDFVYYQMVNDIRNLTEAPYDDSIQTDCQQPSFTRRIQGGKDTKAMHIKWKKIEGIWSFSIIDAKGHIFSWDRESDAGELDIEIEGNYCNCVFYYEMPLPSRVGITSIEELQEFTKRPYYLYVDYNDSPDSLNPGDVLDEKKIWGMIFYNDGTTEEVKAEELSWDKDQKLHYGENKFTFKENGQGFTFVLTVNLDMKPTWKEKPAAVFYAGEPQRASVQVPAAEGEEFCCLWMLKNQQGVLVAEIEDDTETDIVLPESLPAGRYQLYCYYYTKNDGFLEHKFIQTEFRVRSSGHTASPAPTGTPVPVPTPSAAPIPAKKPGKVSLSLVKKKKAVTVKIKNKAGAAGVQIVYAKNKAMKGRVTVTTKKSLYKIKTKGWKKNQKVYVRARAYFLVGKKKKFGKWGRTVSCKV